MLLDGFVNIPDVERIDVGNAVDRRIEEIFHHRSNAFFEVHGEDRFRRLHEEVVFLGAMRTDDTTSHRLAAGVGKVDQDGPAHKGAALVGDLAVELVYASFQPDDQTLRKAYHRIQRYANVDDQLVLIDRVVQAGC